MDINIVLFDCSRKLNSKDRSIIKLVSEKNNIYVINKIDLKRVLDEEKLRRLIKKVPQRISVKENKNIDKLEKSIKKIIDKYIEYKSSIPVLIKERYVNIIRLVLNEIEKTIISIKNNEIPEAVAINLRSITEKLSEITGEIYTEDILNNIFSKFCIGK